MLCHFAGKGKSGRATSDNGDTFTAFPEYRCYWHFFRVFAGIVCGKAFEVADGYRLSSGLEMYTLAFALFFLRAYTSADSRQ